MMPQNVVREGWAEGTERLAELGLSDEEAEWLNLPVEGDDDWIW